MNYAMLLARGRRATMPVILIASQPQNAVSITGEATFSVSAFADTGASLAYQWQRSANAGTTWADIQGQTASTISLSGLSESDDESLYRVLVSAARATTVVSDSATLRFAVGGIVITSQPVDVTHNRGTSPSVTMSAYSAVAGGTVSYGLELDVDGNGTWDQVISTQGAQLDSQPSGNIRYIRYQLFLVLNGQSTFARYSRVATITTIG